MRKILIILLLLLKYQSYAQVVSLPYFENWDNGTTAWSVVTTGDTLTQWELGTPAFGITTGTYSGSNSWDINLTTAYGNLANTELISPVFDFSNAINATLSFWQLRNSEIDWDGLRTDYSTDGGITWNMLGNYADTTATNWYNFSFLNSSGMPGWAGISAGWTKCSIKLGMLNGLPSVKFRLVFTSDQSITRDGISIDDFRIKLPFAIDAETTIITNPTNYSPSGFNSPVRIKIKNEGAAPISNIPVSYQINSGPLVSETASISILPGSSQYYQFATPFVVPSGNYTVLCRTNLANDGDPLNDTISISLNSVPVYVLEYTNNFDSGVNDWRTEIIQDPTTNWQLGNPNYGLTTGSYSAPNCWDINLYSHYGQTAKCNLYTPFFNIGSSIEPVLKFWQNRDLSLQADGLRIDYRMGLDTTWYILGTYNQPGATNWYNQVSVSSSNGLPGWDQVSNGWEQSTFPLDSIPNVNLVQFRFVFTAGSFISHSGVSIDNFEVSALFSEDAALLSFIDPISIVFAGTNQPVTVELKNKGFNTLTNTNIVFIHNNNTPITYNWNGNLSPGATTSVTIGSFIVDPTFNQLKAYIDWQADLNQNNDTIQHILATRLLTPPPYITDFENGSSGWYFENGGNTGSVWESGLPAFGTTNSTHSGNICWDINLNAPYGPLAISRLYSPYFDLTNPLSLSLDFWINYETEFFQDGLRLEYTTNGNTWNVLGTSADPNGVNWYTGTITPQNKPGWYGNSGGWVHCQYTTQQFTGANFVQFRFVFTSDISLSASGCSVDDFTINQIIGLNDLQNTSEFQIYPNPASEQLHIVLSDTHIKEGVISIYDVNGRVVIHQDFQQIEPKESIDLSVKELSSGFYTIKIENTAGVWRKSFLKK